MPLLAERYRFEHALSQSDLSQLVCETVYVSPLSNYLSFLHAQSGDALALAPFAPCRASKAAQGQARAVAATVSCGPCAHRLLRLG